MKLEFQNFLKANITGLYYYQPDEYLSSHTEPPSTKYIC